LCQPVSPLDNGQHPGFIFIGNGIGPTRTAVAIFFDQFSGQFYCFSGTASFFGYNPSQHVTDSTSGEIFAFFPGRTAIGGDDHSLIIDETISKFLFGSLNPEKAIDLTAGLINSALAEIYFNFLAIIFWSHFSDIDDNLTVIILIMGNHDRAVGTGLFPNKNGVAVELVPVRVSLIKGVDPQTSSN